LLFGYNYLKGTNIFQRTDQVYIRFDKIDGLKVANPVMINGLNIGKVEALTLLNDANHSILATLSFRRDVLIPKNSVFKIASSDLLGTKIIRVEYSAEKTFIAAGDTLIGQSEISLMEDFSRQIDPVKRKAEHVINGMDSLLTELHTWFNKGGRNNLIASVSDLETTIRNFKETSEKVNKLVGNESERLNQIIRNVASISENLKKNNDEISHAIENIDKITDDIAKSDLKKTIENTNATITDLNTVVAKIKNGQGSLGMLVNDETLYKNLQQTSGDLDKLVVDIKQNPGRYIKVSVFGKENKEEKQDNKKK
jgi:phospholipid/cholesterol/gamma-HCH transport system substrate-binding protein